MSSPELPELPTDPLADELQAFVVRHKLGARYRALDRVPAFPWEEFRAMGAAHWLGLHFPPKWGGRGLSLLRTGRLLYLLGYWCGTTFAKISLQPEFCSVLAEQGSPDLVEEYFLPLIGGRTLIGNHITEPDAGSDLSRVGMVAERDGDFYVLTGTKSEAVFVKDATSALVYARAPSPSAAASGLTAFLVPQDRPGIRAEVIGDLGERWMRRGQVHYDHVRLPADHRIGEEGQGLAYLLPELVRERGLLALIYLGVARASWEETVTRVGERIAFDRPLARHEAIAFPLVRDGADLESTRLLAESALGALAEGRPAIRETALAKVVATEVALRVLDHAIQFHGGAGYSVQFAHEQRWRDVRSGSLAHGSTELLYHVAARQLWRKRSGAGVGSR